ncbi:hypothetical protein P7C73_g815, partial [Tremellales sp. Uapishka_1]
MASEVQDELYDLSPADAQELRSFVEKRKWFEGKLKVLSSLPAIYPFLHPVLLPLDGPSSSSEYTYLMNGSSLVLPDIPQLEKWKKERDDLEAEVSRFDGGDLGRMKEKTRAATLLPLTPPSTHLVSITLSLILLIDKLLTLLRHRGELLVLTTLRLKWDQLRWEVMAEVKKVRAEVHNIARGQGRWMPPPMAQSASRSPRVETRRLTLESGIHNKLGPTSPSPLSTSSQLPSLSHPRTPSHSSIALPDSPYLTPQSQSRTPRHSTPTQRSLHLPLLHSQIVNLKIRQQNLSATLLTRSGGILDKMIDCAGPLKDLGDTLGPPNVKLTEGKKTEGGAVPEAFLDIQDGLDADVEELEKRIEWCRSLEDHFARAEAHYIASSRTRGEAEMLLHELQGALNEPATSRTHLHLSNLLNNARATLPLSIDDRFPRPKYSLYPELEHWGLDVIATLEEHRSEAEGTLDECQRAVELYDALVKARDKVFTYREAMIDSETKIRQATDEVENGGPNVDDVVTLNQDWSRWLEGYPISVEKLSNLATKSTETTQRATLAIRAYSRLCKSPPAGFHIETDENLVQEVESLAESLLESAKRSERLMATMAEEREMLPLAQRLYRSLSTIPEATTQLRQLVDFAAVNSAWRKESDVPAKMPDFEMEMRDLEDRFESRIIGPLVDLKAVLRNRSRSFTKLRTCFEDGARSAGEGFEGLRASGDLLRRIRRQSAIVQEIEAESEILLETISDLQDRIGEDLVSEIDSLGVEYRKWDASISARVPFISARQSLLPSVPADVSPLTPPESPTSLSPGLDLETLDQRVRNHVNERSALVGAGIAGLGQSLEERRKLGVEKVDAILKRWVSIKNEIQLKSDDLEEAIQRERSLSPAGARALVIAVEDLTASSVNRLSRLRVELEDSSNTIRLLGSAETNRLHAAMKETEEMAIAIDQLLSLAQSRLEEALRIRSRGEAALCESVAATQVDVFGPRSHTSSMIPRPSKSSRTPKSSTEAPDNVGSQIERLRKRVESLHVDLIVYPPPTDLQITPSLRRLPGEDTRSRITSALKDISLKVDGIKLSPSDESEDDLSSLKDALHVRKSMLPQLDRLVVVSSVVRECDSVLSKLLEMTDDDSVGQIHRVRAGTEKVNSSIIKLRNSVIGVEGDRRVGAELKRILRTWAELQILAEEVLHPGQKFLVADNNGVLDDTVSTATSVVRNGTSGSMQSGSMRRPASSASRSTSNPVYSHVRASTESSRNRHASTSLADSPTRSRVLSLKSGPQKPRASLPSFSSRDREKDSSRVPVPLSSLPPKKGYVANPKNKLDIAVGNIVNKMEVNIPIVPVGLNSAGEEWKDQSGRYWIGAEGRAKLCFCRILRSRTVMVRVGGGWVELSKFLLDHFADMLGQWQTPLDDQTTTTPYNSHLPVPITSTSLAAVTPMKSSTPTSDFLSPHPESSTTNRSRRRSSLSPGVSSPGSPLVPLHFIKKASDSPPVREREKERLQAGRRSILGREG